MPDFCRLARYFKKKTTKHKTTLTRWYASVFMLVSMLNEHVKAKLGAPGNPDFGW